MQTIEAGTGLWYTQRNLEDEAFRTFIKKATLAFSVSENDYELWTDEQKQQWEQQHPLADE